MSKRRVLFVMHMPPPVHGAAVVGAQIRDSRRVSDAFECRYLNLSASSSLEEIGRRRFRKLFFVAHLLRQVLRELRGWKPDLVYLTPTSQLPALFKDFAVACLARMYGCKRVLHFHNVGVAARSDRWLDDWVYRRLFDDARVILLSDRLRPDVGGGNGISCRAGFIGTCCAVRIKPFPFKGHLYPVGSLPDPAWKSCSFPV